MLPRIIFVCGLAFTPFLALSADDQFSSLLRQGAGASERDVERFLQAGSVLAKILPHAKPGEIGAVGAVRIPVTVDFFIEQFQDIEAFKRGPATVGIGKFSTPPREQSMAQLTLGSKDLHAIEGCRPGKCPMKLSSEMMAQLHNGATLTHRNANLEEKFRLVLLNYLSNYIAKGTPAMIVYSDTSPPIQSSKEFLELLGQFPWLGKEAPRLLGALRDPLQEPRPEIKDFFYWSKESFGLKPVVSMTHVLILKTTVDGKPWAFIGSKQIYADHYFDASLGLTVLAGESVDRTLPGLSVAYFNRSQTDGLRGWLASIERSIVERRIQSWIAKSLAEMRDRLSKSYGDRAS